MRNIDIYRLAESSLEKAKIAKDNKCSGIIVENTHTTAEKEHALQQMLILTNKILARLRRK